MSGYLHDIHTPEEISLGYVSKEAPDVLEDLETATIPLSDSDAEKGDANLMKCDISEAAIIGNSEPPLDSVKTYHVKEAHETSPFKQAVKGFVLNKLSKKVASSHILSGLTEKLVKKLEEGNDNPLVLNPSSNFENSHPISTVKESNSDVSLDSASCELKSVVANESTELSNVEEATECFEEAKALLTVSQGNGKLKLEQKHVSRSLPSSPARPLGRRASVGFDRCSDIEENRAFEPSSVPSSKLFQDLFVKSSSFDNENGIELDQKIHATEQETSSSEQNNFQRSDEPPTNTFVSREGGSRNAYSMLGKFSHAFHVIRSLFLSLPFPHMILLASILIHNSHFLSSLYVHYIFDSLVMAYVGYTVICILMQTATTKVPVHPVYNDTHLENATLSHSPQKIRGSVKILKGKYDPEDHNLPTELVNICVENQQISFTQIPASSSKDSDDSRPLCESFNLCGGKISLVPKGLAKKRLFHKKYPICIKLPHSTKKLSIVALQDSYCEEDADYISLTPFADGLIEANNLRAIYIYALTDREKESLFWALRSNAGRCDKHSPSPNMTLSAGTSEFDMCSMSYLSLLESNTEESLSVTEDSSGTVSDIKLVPKEPSLSFEKYSKILFENYEKEVVEQRAKLECLSTTNKDVANKTSYLEWLNVVLGRLFYDFLTQEMWSEYVMTKVQKKLDKLELPTFVESLKVTDIAMGDSIPHLHSVSSPMQDDLGVWLDFDFIYQGSFQMTLQAKMTIPKGKQIQNTEVLDSTDNKQINDSDASDDDGTGSRTQSPKQSKLINKIEKWVSYKRFQAVAQSRFVKKYVGDISNMTVTLTLEVNKLDGVMTFNIPPVPSDRVWYGFRNDPIISIAVYPKVGTHEINLSSIIQIIERKLIQAFKKAIVMPNMDDIVIPIMYSPIYGS